MKSKRIEQLCFENELQEPDLLISFIIKITSKKEFDYQQYEYDITEDDFKEWIKRFKSGNPVRFMTRDEAKSFIAILMRYV